METPARGCGLQCSSADNVHVPGDIILTGVDCAEQFDLAADAKIPGPGTILVIDNKGGLPVSHVEYDRDYRHGILLYNRRGSSDRRVAVAFAGKVCSKVDAQYAPVAIGNMLTISPTPGHAMKARQRTPSARWSARRCRYLIVIKADPIVVACH
jgi:hypothetical protein